MFKMGVKIVNKVWGKEICMANTDLYCGKKLILDKGKRCSMHFHKIKDETFYIDKGKILIEREGKEEIMFPKDTIRIKPNIYHRFNGLEDSVIIEISTHHDDEDSYRLEGQLSGNVPKEIMEKYK